MADNEDEVMVDAGDDGSDVDGQVPAGDVEGDTGENEPSTTAANETGKDDEGEGKEKEEEEEEEPFEWVIENFSKIEETRYFSAPFKQAGYDWRILLFPRGNKADSLSVYCEVYKNKELPVGWSRGASFSLVIVNQLDPEASVTKGETNTFNSRAPDFGFPKFLDLATAKDPSKGYIVDDRLIIRCKVKRAEIRSRYSSYTSPWSNYDSKKETGFVGLKNQGATCYMNSLLQTMYHLGQFRKAVYEMPTENDWDNNPEKSIPLALQRVFYHLQHSKDAVSTKQLTKSFGWDSLDSFTQHDVQELNRVLCDNLEGKMKGTRVEGTVERLFRGKVFNYIKCVDVDYESTRTEAFYDLQLNVKGCDDLYKSFEDYVEVEMLDGDNKYRAEGHGLQDAKKGVFLLDLPPVLELQLKRFEYNFMTDSMCKINDKHVFPPEIDLDKYLAPDADRSKSSKYVLFSVLVHSGDVHGGHYYAYIRPTTGPQWFKFDDDRVTKVTADQALDKNFGGEERVTHVNYYGQKVTSVRKKYANAYMLVYIRDTEIDDILSPVEDEDIPVYLKEQFAREAEAEEQRKKDKAEAHLYATVKVVFEDDLKKSISDMGFVNFEKDDLLRTKLKWRQTLGDLKAEVIKQKELPISPSELRFWRTELRPNNTRRPSYALDDDSITLERVCYSTSELRVFAEVCTTKTDDGVVQFQDGSEKSSLALMFFKEYSTEGETPTLNFCRAAYVPLSWTGKQLKEFCRTLGGYDTEQDVTVFEEERASQVLEIPDEETLRKAEMCSGDIVVFQKTPAEDSTAEFKLAPDWYTHILYRIEVDFYPRDKPEEKAFSLKLSKKDSYTSVAERVGQELEWDPMKLRFTTFCNYYKKPYRLPVKYAPTKQLKEMLQSYPRGAVTPILYFEKLEIDLPDLETKKSLKIKWVNTEGEVTEEVKVLVNRDARIGDVKAVVRSKCT